MRPFFVALFFLVSTSTRLVAAPYAGFFIPDSLSEVTLKYKTIQNLIIVPVMINDSIQVNLILDTGCRNMILFGKKFENHFTTEMKPVEFSGLGSGTHVKGKLALNNHVQIGAVTGNRIPIIIVPQKNLFSAFPNVHGVIGYEIFIKFEIEIDFPRQLMTFRPASCAAQNNDYQYVPMKIVDSRPIVPCSITIDNVPQKIEELLIDTGSSLGLIVGSTGSQTTTDESVVGRGLNGKIKGRFLTMQSLHLDAMEFTNVNTSVIYERQNYASIGMDILKDYRVVLNYAKAYVGFRKEG